MTSNKIEELEKQKDNAYWERNQLVAALSKSSMYPRTALSETLSSMRVSKEG